MNIDESVVSDCAPVKDVTGVLSKHDSMFESKESKRNHHELVSLLPRSISSPLARTKRSHHLLSKDTLVLTVRKQHNIRYIHPLDFNFNHINSISKNQRIMTMEPEFWSGLGAAAAIFLTATGAAMASAEGGTFALHQKGILAFVPIVQAGVLAIYGIIIAILIVLKQDDETTAITEAQAYRHLAAGLSVGFACWASGYGMSLFLKQCNQTTGMTMTMSTTTNTARGDESQPLLSPSTSNSASGGNHPPAVLVEYKRLIMVLIFLESIGLYGLIAALFLLGK